MTNHHDALFLKIFGRPEQAAALLQCALAPAVRTQMGWERFAPVPADFRNGLLQGHRADLLFAAPAIGPPYRCVYLLLEHKTGRDPRTHAQLHRYVQRVRQRHREVHPDTPEPAVIPVLVQFGPRPLRPPEPDTAPTEPDPSTPLDPFRQSRQDVVLDLARWDESSVRALELLPVGRLVALCQRFLPRAARMDAAACLLRWIDLLDAVARDDPGEDIEAVCSYVLEVTDMSFAELQALIDRMFADQPKEVFMSTAEKLRRLGREEGRAELLLQQLAARFGPVPEAVTQRVRGAGREELDRWAIAVLTAASLADVLAA